MAHRPGSNQNLPLVEKGPVMAESLFTESAPIEQEQVEYREIQGFTGYRAGSDGTIWSCWKAQGTGYAGIIRKVMSERWKQLKPDCRKEDGRKRYTLRGENGTYKRKYGSHWVLIAFVGPCPPGMEACHNDGNCLNDHVGNLRWDTSVANKADMKRHGTQICGEKHPKAKIADEDIPVIIQMRKDGLSLKAIASKFRVSGQRIYQICKKGAR